MVTLKVKNSLTNNDLKVSGVNLKSDTPVDVILMIINGDASQKPPTGKIWIMRKALIRSGDAEIDQFGTFASNGLDETIEYVLIAVGS